MFPGNGYPGVTNFQVLLALASFIPTPASRDFFHLYLAVDLRDAKVMNIEFKRFR